MRRHPGWRASALPIAERPFFFAALSMKDGIIREEEAMEKQE